MKSPATATVTAKHGAKTTSRKKRRSQRVRGGALLLLSILLTGSAVVRIGVEAAPAIGRELTNADTSGTDSETGPGQEQGQTASTTRASFESAEDLRPMLAAFQQRESALIRREQQIEDRMAALTIAEEAVDRKLKALVEAEVRLKETLSLADGAAEGDLTRLTEMYEKMKPKESAALFEEMDPQFAAGFLSRMRPEVAAGILAGMAPQSAYTISVVLAGRNATVPRN